MLQPSIYSNKFSLRKLIEHVPRVGDSNNLSGMKKKSTITLGQFIKHVPRADKSDCRD